MIETQGLTFSYSPEVVFRYPDLHIQTGESWLIAGRSGSGKTTLLHLLLGILRPSHGQISINGIFLNELSPSRLDTFRARYYGMIFQKHLFLQDVSMRTNLKVASRLAQAHIAEDYQIKLLQNLGIDHLLDKKPSSLSQGELQRFSIARAMIHRPLILFADEPTSALDDQNCHAFIQLLNDITAKNATTLVIATHDARLRSLFSHQIQLDNN